MSEHDILQLMVGFVALEGLVLGYFTYRLFHASENLKGMISATYLRVHRALTQIR